MSQQDVPESRQSSLKWVLWGSILASLMLVLAFRRLFCFYAFQFTPAALLSLVVGTVAGLLGNLWKAMDVKIFRPVANILLGLLVMLGLVLFIAPAVVDLNMNYCVREFPVLVDMVNQEAGAVVNEDMNVIHSIYDPSAVVTRMDTQETLNAYIYYSQKFSNEEHCTINHSDYLVQKYSKDQVRMTTSSQGTYGMEGQGCTIAYDNPPGSDQWTFQKINGKWKIINFEFNIKK